MQQYLRGVSVKRILSLNEASELSVYANYLFQCINVTEVGTVILFYGYTSSRTRAHSSLTLFRLKKWLLPPLMMAMTATMIVSIFSIRVLSPLQKSVN
jgi:hypothetical protein